MYIILIEPLYSQGTGMFRMKTENINNAEIFRQELLKFRNWLVTTDDEIDAWEFNEYIYKLDDSDDNKEWYDGYLVAKNEYSGEKFNKLKKINWTKMKSKTLETEICRKMINEDCVYSDEYKDGCPLKQYNILL